MAEATEINDITEEKNNTTEQAEEQTQVAEESSASPTDEKASGTDGTEHIQVKAANFPEAGKSEDIGKGSIDMILNMSVPVTVCIGQTQISIQRLLQLGQGSVIKLDKPISEPMELYLNGQKFATGEVVVIDDQFAVRIKNIIDLTGGDACNAG